MMNTRIKSFGPRKATQFTASVIGVFFGLLSGVNHGIFEILQGNLPTSGLVINAIGEAQRFWPEGTEPAFTLIPNYCLTGIVSILVGITIVIWSLRRLEDKQGPVVYLGLFILSFLVGGGMGQAFFFIPASIFLMRRGKFPRWLPQRSRPFLSQLWPAVLVLAVLTMLVGLEMAIFGWLPGVSNSAQLHNLNMLFVFGSLLLFILTFIAASAREDA
jgi:hypothetical protein